MLQGLQGKTARLLADEIAKRDEGSRLDAICASPKVDEHRTPGLTVVVHVLVDSMQEAVKLKAAVMEARDLMTDQRFIPELAMQPLLEGDIQERVKSLTTLFRSGAEVTASVGEIMWWDFYTEYISCWLTQSFIKRVNRAKSRDVTSVR